MKAPTCPICRKAPPSTDYKPFCSRRCADVDLQHWFTGRYAVPGVETPEGAPDQTEFEED